MKAHSYLNLTWNYHNQISQEQLFLKKKKCAKVYNFPVNPDALAEKTSSDFYSVEISSTNFKYWQKEAPM